MATTSFSGILKRMTHCSPRSMRVRTSSAGRASEVASRSRTA